MYCVAALHHAAMSNIAMAVRMLLDVRADTTIVNKDGLTALEIARSRLRSDSSVRRLLKEDEQLQHLSQWTSISVRSLPLTNIYPRANFAIHDRNTLLRIICTSSHFSCHGWYFLLPLPTRARCSHHATKSCMYVHLCCYVSHLERHQLI